MIDPLAEVVTLLQPAARYFKVVNGAGCWGVRRTDVSHPFYCAVLAGSARLTPEGEAPVTLRQGDFVLMPAASNFTMTSASPSDPEQFITQPVVQPDGEIRSGDGQMHGDIARGWTVAELAKTAALSRSAFFERFSRIMGVAPMAWLLAWRMAQAKRLLLHEESVAGVAERTGYRSASAFSVAFTRYVGVSPGRYRETVISSQRPEDTASPPPDRTLQMTGSAEIQI